MLSPQLNNNYAWKIAVNDNDVGTLLFRLCPEKTIYIDQLFILSNWQKKKIASRVLEESLKQFFPEYIRYEVLTRSQNKKALSFYKNLHYIEDKSGVLVQKYHYPPSRYRYMGLSKKN